VTDELLQARIHSRVCELKVLACEAALQYGRDRREEYEQPSVVALMLRRAVMKRMRRMKRAASDGNKSSD
jgi:hypothetical protein